MNFCHLLIFLLPTLLFAQLPQDSLTPEPAAAAFFGHIVHQPPKAILNDRPYIMDLFLNFDSSEVAAVSLFLRDDSSQGFREIPLEGRFGRYRHVLLVEALRGTQLTYFFLVTLRDWRLWAYPLAPDGHIQPFVIDLVPPTQKFFQNRLYD
ncbi:MAG: hypothetical protein ACE5Q6_23615 [Dehalococcoidia bacterium]